MVWDQSSQYWQFLPITFHILAQKICPYELIFYAHIEENNTSTFWLIKKKNNLIKQIWRNSRVKILAIEIELIAGAKILKLKLAHLNISIRHYFSRTYSRKQYKHTLLFKKSRIRETMNLSAGANSSTNLFFSRCHCRKGFQLKKKN